MSNRSHAGLIGLVAGVYMLTGCIAATPAATPPATPTATPAATSGTEPRVYFANVEDGATITTPTTVTMASENFVVVPSGEPKAGEGHLHIMVDTPCVADGEVIVKDDAHLHFGQGQLEADLTLSPGEHTLCLQAADGAHMALPGEGMRQLIAVTVQ